MSLLTKNMMNQLVILLMNSHQRVVVFLLVLVNQMLNQNIQQNVNSVRLFINSFQIYQILMPLNKMLNYYQIKYVRFYQVICNKIVQILFVMIWDIVLHEFMLIFSLHSKFYFYCKMYFKINNQIYLQKEYKDLYMLIFQK